MPIYNVLNRYGGIQTEVHAMREKSERSDRERTERRARVLKEKICESDFTPDELQELRRVAGDIIDRKRY